MAPLPCTDADPSYVNEPHVDTSHNEGPHDFISGHQYNARKQQVVREIYQRAFAAAGLTEK